MPPFGEGMVDITNFLAGWKTVRGMDVTSSLLTIWAQRQFIKPPEERQVFEMLRSRNPGPLIAFLIEVARAQRPRTLIALLLALVVKWAAARLRAKLYMRAAPVLEDDVNASVPYCLIRMEGQTWIAHGDQMWPANNAAEMGLQVTYSPDGSILHVTRVAPKAIQKKASAHAETSVVSECMVPSSVPRAADLKPYEIVFGLSSGGIIYNHSAGTLLLIIKQINHFTNKIYETNKLFYANTYNSFVYTTNKLFYPLYKQINYFTQTQQFFCLYNQ